jgi:hypothetical protein
MFSVRYCVLPAIVAGLVAAIPAVAGDSPAGMVMKITGDTTPPLPAMSEIPADTSVTLGPSTTVTFLHYARCKLVTVSGGKITLTADDFTESDGKVVSETAGPCPRIHQLSSLASAGGGLRPAPNWGPSAGLPSTQPATPWKAADASLLPINAQIVFAGTHAGQISGAALYRDDQRDKPLAQLQLSGRSATLPPGVVSPNSRYVLSIGVNGQPQPMFFTFLGAAPSGSDSLVVLRVD